MNKHVYAHPSTCIETQHAENKKSHVIMRELLALKHMVIMTMMCICAHVHAASSIGAQGRLGELQVY
jgi:hypothetical protein